MAKLGGGDDEEGFFYVRGTDCFIRDRASVPLLTDSALRSYALSHGQPLTYTCVPPGSGQRIGVDRDGDGAFDGDERDANTNPDDPANMP